jgi:tripartite-type tricarboxylate transporter receptor subunit TctC
MIASPSAVFVNPIIMKNVNYVTERDFVPVTLVTTSPLVVAVHPSVPAGTLRELIDYAKKNPGKLNLGAINPGSTQNLSAHLFQQMTGIDATVVTYRTTPDLITGVLRGDIDLAFDYYAAFNAPLSDNKIRIVASADDERNPLLPNVPTVKESGIPDYVVTSWNALSAPRGLPQDILAILNRDIVAALADPDLRKKARDFGLNAQGSTPEAMSERMARDIKRWAVVIEKAGIPKQ